MTAVQKSELIARRLGIPWDAANVLRRAELVLHRWAELECGDGNDYASWAIERDEESGKPYMCRYPHQGTATRSPVADREAGALRRVAATCAQLAPCGSADFPLTRNTLPDVTGTVERSAD